MWGADDESWTLSELAAKEVGQPTVHAAPGTIESLSFDPEQVKLEVQVLTNYAGCAQVFAPQRWFGENPVVILNGERADWESAGPERYLVLVPEGSHIIQVQ